MKNKKIERDENCFVKSKKKTTPKKLKSKLFFVDTRTLKKQREEIMKAWKSSGILDGLRFDPNLMSEL